MQLLTWDCVGELVECLWEAAAYGLPPWKWWCDAVGQRGSRSRRRAERGVEGREDSWDGEAPRPPSVCHRTRLWTSLVPLTSRPRCSFGYSAPER